MRIDDQIKRVCLKTDISASEVGRRLNKSPQAFLQKMKRGTFTLDDLYDIALVTGCELHCSFVFPDGDTVVIR